jgi:FkbM family methyltransferase
MAWTKYLKPIKYLDYTKRRILDSKIQSKKPLIINTPFENEIIHFSVTSHKELWRANASFTREPLTIDWICNYVGNNDIIMDIGANVGAYSLLIAKMKKKSLVYAIEPESSNFFALNRNIIVNGFQEKIIPLCVALGEKNTINSLYLSNIEPGSALHGLETPESEGVDFAPKHVQGIAEYKLDNLVEELEHKHINHLKIDVDGFEDRVVKGGINLLKNKYCKTVLIESYESTIGYIREVLEHSGFLEKKRNEILMPSGRGYNILYLKR